jgi:ABC-type multidrug transport system ATPase subunit
MQGRTVILVSHHVQLCSPGASYIVALDNGRVQFAGNNDGFQKSGVLRTLIQTTDAADAKEEETVEEKIEQDVGPSSETSSTTVAAPQSETKVKKPPRKLVEEEKRAVGRIGKDVWGWYIWACGNAWFLAFFIGILILASLAPVFERNWLR